MLTVGAIDFDTFLRAVKATDEEFKKTQEAKKNPLANLDEGKIKSSLAQLEKALETPFDKFEEKTKEALGLAALGLIDEKQLGKALTNASDEFDASKPKLPERRFAAAVLRGSQEDYAIRIRNTPDRRMQENDAAAKQGEKQVQTLQRVANILGDIRAELRNHGFDTVEIA